MLVFEHLLPFIGDRFDRVFLNGIVLLPRFSLFALHDVLMGVVFVQRRYSTANCKDTRSTALVPPLIAAPQFLFVSGRHGGHFLVDERLAAEDQLLAAARCPREFRTEAIGIVVVVV